MPIEPTRRITETQIIHRQEEAHSQQQQKKKQPKKQEEQKETDKSHKVDIRI